MVVTELACCVALPTKLFCSLMVGSAIIIFWEELSQMYAWLNGYKYRCQRLMFWQFKHFKHTAHWDDCETSPIRVFRSIYPELVPLKFSQSWCSLEHLTWASKTSISGADLPTKVPSGCLGPGWDSPGHVHRDSFCPGRKDKAPPRLWSPSAVAAAGDPFTVWFATVPTSQLS